MRINNHMWTTRKKYNVSSIQLFFCGKSSGKVTPTWLHFAMQFEKKGCGLVREAFWREGECVFSQKRGGKSVLENAVNIQDIWMFAVRCLPSISNCHEYNLVSRFIIYFCIFLFYNFFCVFLCNSGERKKLLTFLQSKTPCKNC